MSGIAIIDYGVGNLRSVEKAFAAAGAQAVISNDESVLRKASALVLPGVGAFAHCMTELAKRGFGELVHESVAQGKPLLGVCVGMQMLFDESEEFGATAGLGLLRGRVRRFAGELVVPQVGWNQVRQRCSNPLLDGVGDSAFFYFVHSYFCEVDDQAVAIGETDYGVPYASVVAQGSVYGVQFHPEKSQSAGLCLLANFSNMKTEKDQVSTTSR